MENAAEQQLAAEWAAAKAGLPGVAALRESAFERFAATGLPHRRVEEWKYTDLRALMRDAKPLAAPPDAAARARAVKAGAILSDIDARRLVIVDGAFVPEWSDLESLDAGVSIVSLATWLAGPDAYRLGQTVRVDDVAVSLNTAFMSDGVVIRIGEGVTLAKPLHLVFVTTGEDAVAVFTRSLVVVEKDARAMVVETHE